VKRVELDYSLYHFLLRQGFAFMALKGVEENPDRKPTENSVYLLQPSKENLRLKFTEIDTAYEPMDSTEVKEMLQGCSGIAFHVELEDEIAKEFIKYKNTI
jgi:hypothetical protein